MTLGERLKGRDNALNALRLVFAVLVIFSHSFSLLDHPELAYVGVPLGGWAVAGFFAISGYLIPRARMHTDPVTFLLRRGRRIYPAFWACCAIVAFVCSPIAAHLTGTAYQPRAALTYVATNVTTYMNQQVIGMETAGAPPNLVMWNGPAWTLVFEIACYLIAWAALTLTTVRRHQTTAALVAYAVATTAAIVSHSQHGLGWFVALFAAGWVVSSRADHLKPTRATTLIALALAFAAGMLHPTLAVIPLAYAVLGAGALLPCRWFTTNDISYGTYLYGFPIQQLLIVVGINTLGLLVFTTAAIARALAAGAGSWFLLERHCLPKRTRPGAASVPTPHAISQSFPAATGALTRSTRPVVSE